MNLKIKKFEKGIILEGEIPSEILKFQEAELFYLKDGIYLLSTKGKLEEAVKRDEKLPLEKAYSEKELLLIKKLLNIKFENRTPEQVDKILSEEEKRILQGLEKKGKVTVFFGKKYAKVGVYNIADDAFELAKNFEKKDYWVIEQEEEMKKFTQENQQKIIGGQIIGIKGFDKKYYFLKKEFYEEWEGPVKSALDEEGKTAEEIAEKLKIPKDAAVCLLVHLCEKGEVIEKRKGKYARA